MRELSQIERWVELIKVLQDYEGTNPELAKELDITENTLESDKKSLRNGIKIFGWQIKLNLEKRKKNYGESSDLEKSRFHPLFLCLNTTEVYVLLRALDSSKYIGVADRIRSLLYTQLSDAGKGALEEFAPKLNFINEIKDKEFKALEQSELYTPENLDLYFLKPDYTVQIELVGGFKYTGKLQPFESRYRIKLKNGSFSDPFDPSQIKVISRSS